MEDCHIHINGIYLKTYKGRLLLNALKDANIYLPAFCGGVGECAECLVCIKKGQHNLSEISDKELQALGPKVNSDYRLACQCCINSDIELKLGK